MQSDVYQMVTDRILAQLEAGTVPWRKPWNQTGEPANLTTKRPYRGINPFLLDSHKYTSPYWLTFRQAHDLGGNVLSGEKGSPVVFWKRWEVDRQPDPTAPTAEPEKVSIPILRYYHVWNVQQCRLPDGKVPPPAPAIHHEPIPEAEAIVAGFDRRPPVEPDSRAVYYPSRDVVGMPALGSFHAPEGYYATLFHELAHATGHGSRLSRPLADCAAPFGSCDYSREELVAEFGASYLCGVCGILPAVVDNSAAYIDGWRTRLKAEPRAVVIAAAQGQRAADWIRGIRHTSDNT